MSGLVVCCSEVADPNWSWIQKSLHDSSLRFEFVRCLPRSWIEHKIKFINISRIRGCYDAVRLAKRQKALVLVTHGPTLAAWCGIFGWIFGLRSSLLAHSFNFVELPSFLKVGLFKFGLRKVDRFMTFSRVERSIYARAFNLPEDRFEFVFWGANPPNIVGAAEFVDYVSSIGGNARDYGTLIKAARNLPHVRFVIVGRPENFANVEIPANVVVKVNTTLDCAMNILNYSRFMVLPLDSSEVPCGHVTIVAAMHLGKATLVTDSSGLDDYVIENVNSMVSPTKDSAALARSITALWDTQEICARLGANAKAFASANCTEQNIAENFRGYLGRLSKAVAATNAS